MPISHGPGIVVGSPSSYVGEGAIGAPDTGAPITLSASPNIAASGENTTFQLTAPSGKGSGDFTVGRIQDDENPSDAIDIAVDDFTEIEWCLIATTAAIDGAVYEFRVFLADDTPLDTYTVTPTWTIGTTERSFGLVSLEDSPLEILEEDEWQQFFTFAGDELPPDVPKVYFEDCNEPELEPDNWAVCALPSDDDAQFEHLEDAPEEDLEIGEWVFNALPSDDDAQFEYLEDSQIEDFEIETEWALKPPPSDDDAIYTWLDEADEDNEAVSEWIFNALPSDDDAIFGWVDDELESVEAEDGLEWVFNALSVELAGDEAQFAYLEDAIAEELEADEWILNALPSDDDAHFEFIDEAESTEDVADEFAVWLSEVFIAPEDFQALAFIEDAEILLDEPDEWVSPLLSADAIVIEDESITIEFIDELEVEAEASDEFYVTPLADDEQPVVLASLEDAPADEIDHDDFVGSVVVEAEALAQSFFEDAEALDAFDTSDEFVLSAISEAEQIVNAYLEDAPSDDEPSDAIDFISNPLHFVLIPEESLFAIWIDDDDLSIIKTALDGEDFYASPVRASQVFRRFRAKLSDARAATNVTLADAKIKGASLSDSLRRASKLSDD